MWTDLNGNKIYDEGVDAIGDALLENNTLSEICSDMIRYAKSLLQDESQFECRTNRK